MREGKTEGAMRLETTSSKNKQYRGTIATNAKALSLAKKVGSISTVNSDRTYSDGRSRENECRNGMP